MERLILYLLFFSLFISCHDSIIEDNNDIEKIEKIERFTIKVNTNLDDEKDGVKLEEDRCVLILPSNYSEDKRSQIRLVIYCHSGGGFVGTNSSEAENADFVKYFVSKGYAVLSVSGIPESYAIDMRIDKGRTVGSPISLNSNVLGYKYVIENYNIAKDGCFIFSNSNGGLMASNIVNLTNIPVLAQSGLAPLLSIERNGWFIPSGPVFLKHFLAYQNRANIIRIFGMENVETQEQLNSAVYEKEKVAQYDPFDYCIHQTSKPYRAPYLIFSFKNDVSIYYDIAKEFSEQMNARGSEVILNDTDEYGGHNVPSNPIIVGDFNYIGQNIPLKLTVKVVGDFFDSYNPDINDRK